MRGPYFWRHAGLLLLFALNFAISVAIARWASAAFRPPALPASVTLRSLSVLYLTVSALALLFAVSLFATLETGEAAERCWRTNAAWSKLQPGMTRPRVIELLGEPAEIRFDSHYLYPIHPLGGHLLASVSFEEKIGGGQLSSDAKVTGKNPETEGEWLPPGWQDTLRRHVLSDALPICGAGLILLAVASIIPLHLRAGANSWMLYLPVAAVVLGTTYEYAQEGGWRFDLMFIFGPAYLVIAAAWLIRVWIVAKA